MGMYDQLLSLTQQGLDRNNQIAMTSAQQPTMADVFMDRFRQGGQDRLAQQKAAEQSRMNEATMKNMEAQRQHQAMSGAANLGTDETTQAWEDLQRGTGIKTPVSGPGQKQRQLEQALLIMQDRLDQQRLLAGQTDATKRYAIDEAGKKPLTPLEKINKALGRGGLSPEDAAREKAKATYIQPQQPMSAPISAVSNETGAPVLLQPKKAGGVEEVEGYSPVPRSGAGRKPVDPKKVNQILDEIEKVIPQTSGGAVGGALNWVKGQANISDETTRANTKIGAAGASLMMNMPRMEGPQSDKDVALYREQIGKLNSPTTPIGDKKAAVQVIRALNKQYAPQNQTSGASGGPAVGTVVNGKKFKGGDWKKPESWE